MWSTRARSLIIIVIFITIVLFLGDILDGCDHDHLYHVRLDAGWYLGLYSGWLRYYKSSPHLPFKLFLHSGHEARSENNWYQLLKRKENQKKTAKVHFLQRIIDHNHWNHKTCFGNNWSQILKRRKKTKENNSWLTLKNNSLLKRKGKLQKFIPTFEWLMKFDLIWIWFV